VAAVVNDVLAVLRRHHLQLPRALALLLKMVVMTEGMGARLDPQFRLGDVLGPYAERLVADQYSPAAVARRLALVGVDVARLGVELPGQLRRLLDVLDRGVEVHLRAQELEALATRRRRRGWEGPLLSGGIGAVAALGGYLAWTARRGGCGPRRV
jgi:ubiquinone biosynthesis protein